MPSGINKAKGRRSSRKAGYYEKQKHRTAINKSRRAMKRQRKAEYWAKLKLETVPNPS
jgi:hypothetical protein